MMEVVPIGEPLMTTDTVCDSYVWSVTGDTLITSGVYTWVDTLSCDTNILNLTINNSHY